MKKLLTIFASIIAMLACCIMAACGNKEPITADENTVIITASDSYFNFDNKTLKDYMEYLQADEKLTFSASNGMVTAINGKSNTSNSYWTRAIRKMLMKLGGHLSMRVRFMAQLSWEWRH